MVTIRACSEGVQALPFRVVCWLPRLASCSEQPLEDRAMRTFSARSAFIVSAAISGAVILGMVELLALLWTRFTGRYRAMNTSRVG